MKLLEFYKKIFNYFKAYKAFLVLFFIATFTDIILASAYPFLYARLLDTIIPEKRYDELYFWIAFLTFGVVLMIGVWVLQRYTISHLGAKLYNHFREQLFKIFLSNSNSSFGCSKTELMGVVAFHNQNLCNNLMHTAWKALYVIIITPVCFALLFYISWPIATVTISVMLLSFYLSYRYSEKTHLFLAKSQTDDTGINELMSEGLNLQKVCHYFNLYDFLCSMLNKKINKSYTSFYKQSFYLELTALTGGYGVSVVSIYVLWLGALFVMGGQLQIGLLLSFLFFVHMIIGNASLFSGIIPYVIMAIESLDKIESIINNHPKKEELETGVVKFDKLNSGIEVKDLLFSYSENLVILDKINIDIRPKEFIVLVGSSGAGKSTILKLLFGELAPGKGSVKIDGIEASEFDHDTLLEKVGVVFQQVSLFDMSIRDNIRLGKLDASDEEILQAAKNAEIHEDILRMTNGYDTMVGDQGCNLSGGQCQRISIARALIRTPEILILDEPTSVLDAISESSIIHTLNKIAKETTIIAVTHRLKMAVKADRVYVIDKGNIIETGNHKELLEKNGVYSELWRKQIGKDEK